MQSHKRRNHKISCYTRRAEGWEKAPLCEERQEELHQSFTEWPAVDYWRARSWSNCQKGTPPENQLSTFCICVCIQRMGEYLHQPCSHMLGGNQDGLGKGWGSGGAITSHFHRHLFIWPCKTESPTLLWIWWPATPEALQLPVCIPLYIRMWLMVFHFQTHILLRHCSHSNTVLTLKIKEFSGITAQRYNSCLITQV